MDLNYTESRYIFWEYRYIPPLNGNEFPLNLRTSLIGCSSSPLRSIGKIRLLSEFGAQYAHFDTSVKFPGLHQTKLWPEQNSLFWDLAVILGGDSRHISENSQFLIGCSSKPLRSIGMITLLGEFGAQYKSFDETVKFLGLNETEQWPDESCLIWGEFPP